jgi:hypothetical protein
MAIQMGKIRLVEICPACELTIKERLSRSHFLTYKSACMVYTNGNVPEMIENNAYLQEIYDLERLNYVSTIENSENDIRIRPNGRFEKNDSLDGYCINNIHRFE